MFLESEIPGLIEEVNVRFITQGVQYSPEARAGKSAWQVQLRVPPGTLVVCQFLDKVGSKLFRVLNKRMACYDRWYPP